MAAIGTLVKVASESIGSVEHIYEAAVDITSVAAASVSEQDVTITGIGANSYIDYASIVTAGINIGVCGAVVKDDNTVTVKFINPTAAPIDPPNTVVLRVIAIQR